MLAQSLKGKRALCLIVLNTLSCRAMDQDPHNKLQTSSPTTTCKQENNPSIKQQQALTLSFIIKKIKFANAQETPRLVQAYLQHYSAQQSNKNDIAVIQIALEQAEITSSDSLCQLTQAAGLIHNIYQLNFKNENNDPVMSMSDLRSDFNTAKKIIDAIKNTQTLFRRSQKINNETTQQIAANLLTELTHITEEKMSDALQRLEQELNQKKKCHVLGIIEHARFIEPGKQDFVSFEKKHTTDIKKL